MQSLFYEVATGLDTELSNTMNYIHGSHEEYCT